MSETPVSTDSFVVGSVVAQVLKDAVNRGTTPTYQWLEERATFYLKNFGQEPSTHMRTILNRLAKEITPAKSDPANVLSTKIKRDNLITEDDLTRLNYYWPRLKKRITNKISKEAAKKVDEDTNRILIQLPNPKQASSFLCKGLVVGDVQAGKTNNYTALINKASDLGYKLILVLSGVTKNLRVQTQRRLDSDFIGRQSVAERNKESHQRIGVGLDPSTDGTRFPTSITDQTTDFIFKNGLVIESQSNPALIVTIKNAKLLENILDWINGQKDQDDQKFSSPVLIIDDESDNASVNTSDPDENPKAINRLIREIVSRCSKVSYVAYTATPFANIFIDPDSQGDKSGMTDLYPSHFIVVINSPSNYCGGKFFYDKNHAIESPYIRRIIDDAESFIPIKHKANLQPKALPPSLKEALLSFFVASAIKEVRRKNGLLDANQNKYDSCLINASRFIEVQNDLTTVIANYVESINQELALGDRESELLSSMEKVFSNHYRKRAGVQEGWSEVLEIMRRMPEPDVITVHGESKDPLDYEELSSNPRKIAIGGLKLSRGLTLEGLVVSYFYRQSVMYDTLMQMARWFGYRDGWTDLIRLYTTEAASKWYLHITEATIELKRDLIEMEIDGAEPKDFGIRVRGHEESLIVTAKNKMKSGYEVKGHEAFGDKLIETVYVDRRPEINDKNIALVKSFYKTNADKIISYDKNDQGMPKHYLIPNVPATSVTRLLEGLKLDWGNKWARANVLLGYLRSEATVSFETWDVSFQTLFDPKGAISITPDVQITPQERSPVTANKQPLAIGQLLEQSVKNSLCLSDRRKVATGSIDYVGIPEELLTEEHKNSGPAARDWKSKFHPRPVIVFHLIDVNIREALKKCEENHGNPDYDSQVDALVELLKDDKLSNPYLAFSISIPPTNSTSDKKPYVITKKEWELMYGEAFEEDE